MKLFATTDESIDPDQDWIMAGTVTSTLEATHYNSLDHPALQRNEDQQDGQDAEYRGGGEGNRRTAVRGGRTGSTHAGTMPTRASNATYCGAHITTSCALSRSGKLLPVAARSRTDLSVVYR